MRSTSSLTVTSPVTVKIWRNRHLLFIKTAWPFLRNHDDVIKRKHFPRYWPIVRGIHRSPVNSPQKGQWRGAWVFLWSAQWINGWVNTREAGDLRRHRAHYDVTAMLSLSRLPSKFHNGARIWNRFPHYWPFYHVENDRKWPLFFRRHFQTHFREWRYGFRLRFHWSLVQIDNNPAIVPQSIDSLYASFGLNVSR